MKQSSKLLTLALISVALPAAAQEMPEAGAQGDPVQQVLEALDKKSDTDKARSQTQPAPETVMEPVLRVPTSNAAEDAATGETAETPVLPSPDSAETRREATEEGEGAGAAETEATASGSQASPEAPAGVASSPVDAAEPTDSVEAEAEADTRAAPPVPSESVLDGFEENLITVAEAIWTDDVSRNRTPGRRSRGNLTRSRPVVLWMRLEGPTEALEELVARDLLPIRHVWSFAPMTVPVSNGRARLPADLPARTTGDRIPVLSLGKTKQARQQRASTIAANLARHNIGKFDLRAWSYKENVVEGLYRVEVRFNNGDPVFCRREGLATLVPCSFEIFYKPRPRPAPPPAEPEQTSPEASAPDKEGDADKEAPAKAADHTPAADTDTDTHDAPSVHDAEDREDNGEDDGADRRSPLLRDD